MVLNSAEVSTAVREDRTAATTWLKDLKVMSMGASIALTAAQRTFRQLGATVLSPPGEEVERQTHDVWQDADVVLVDRIEGAVGLPGLAAGPAADYLEYVAARNRSVWVTVSAFGMSGDRRDAVASEVTLLAAGGILGHSRVGQDLPPIIPASSIGLKLVGQVTAMAALHGVHARLEGGHPVHVDVSAQGAIVSTGLTLEMGHALAGCPDEGGSARYGAPTGFFQCLDGAVYVIVLEQHQWEGFRASLAPALDSVRTLEEARARTDEVNEALSGWTSSRSVAQCERILQEAGVPCTSVNTVQALIGRSRGAARPFSLEGPSAPMLPAVVTELPGKRPEARSRGIIPLRDLRVLDAGHVLAVPLSTAWLGAMGAQVTKMEDPARLDVYRRRGPFAAGVPGLNRGAYFNHINFCKSSVDIVVDDSRSSLDVSPFDVVMHNVTAGRAARLGIDTSSVTVHDTPKLALASSGFGLTGEWSHYRAYGHNIHAFAGLVAATRDPQGNMADVGTPWADPLTSVALTVWVLAWSLAPQRSSSFAIDISMSELMAAQLDDLLDGDPEEIYRPADTGGDFFVRLPGSERLLSVSLCDAEQVKRYESLVGQPLPALNRRGQLVELRHPGSEDMTVELLEARLRASELPAALVLTAPELADDEVLRSTELLQPVDSRTLGRYYVIGLPWRLTGQPKMPLVAAPERP
jgi:crotonobetainyl-CoA:carnitine CoA-transferase CaiB-like acyl-CoA transferase